MNLLSYHDISVITLRFTDQPGVLTKQACDMTMQTVVDFDLSDEASAKLLKFLITAEHTSVLEHCSITFLVKGVSRSLLAQLSRHRHASLTSQSQHYQDYRQAPMVLSDDLCDGLQTAIVKRGLSQAQETYVLLRDAGVSKEEARQVLPNAAAVNLLWSVNARGLLTFLRPRMCYRNVEEMKIFADKVHAACMLWWPELFQFVGAPCLLGSCNQGPLRSPLCKSQK